MENKPGVHKHDPILIADNVTRKFGGMTAVDVSHFEIERHGITALIGPNGAGKTTFFNLMTGFDTPNTGTWQFDGKDMAHVQPEKVARMGMVRTFQLTKVMSRLTVLDNMLLGAPMQPGEGMFRALFPGMWKRQEKENVEKAEALLERFLLIKKKNDYAGALSGGQRKLLEMARALMSDPQLVMLDEPMAGVNPALKQSLLDHIMALREEGTTVLFVEHDINMVRHIADWVTVMAEGKIVAEGQPKSVMSDPAVIDAYLGAHANVDLGDDSVLEDLKEARDERHRKRHRSGRFVRFSRIGHSGWERGRFDPCADPRGRTRGRAPAGRGRPDRRVHSRREHPQRCLPYLA